MSEFKLGEIYEASPYIDVKYFLCFVFVKINYLKNTHKVFTKKRFQRLMDENTKKWQKLDEYLGRLYKPLVGKMTIGTLDGSTITTLQKNANKTNAAPLVTIPLGYRLVKTSTHIAKMEEQK